MAKTTYGSGPFRIEIHNDKTFKKALKAAGADMKDLTAVHREIADFGVMVTKEAVPKRTGAMAASIKRKATQDRASVSLPWVKKSRKAYFGIVEFGGPHKWYLRGQTKGKRIRMADGSFRTMRSALIKGKPHNADGYYIYPTLRGHKPQFEGMYRNLVEKLKRKYF